MRRWRAGLLALTIFAVLGGGLGVAQDDETPDVLIREFTGEAEPRERSGEELEEAYLRVLDWLLPGMSAADIERRRTPQQIFERMCFQAGAPEPRGRRQALCRAMIARLGPETAPPARIWLMRQLERISGPESLEALSKLLHDPDRYICELARRALQNNPSPKATQVLLDAWIETSATDWAVALLNALAARRDPVCLPHFVELSRSAHPEFARAGIAGLADLGSEPAAAALLEIWASGSATRRAWAEDALLRVADGFVVGGRPGRAAEIFTRLYGESSDQRIRLAALRGLSVTQPGAALTTLTALVRAEGGAGLRFAAVRLMAALPIEEATLRLAQELPELPVEVQVVVLDALARRGDAAARPAVIAALDSRQEVVRVAALGALQHLGNRDSVFLLAQRAARGEEAEQAAARQSLGQLRGAGVDEQIIVELRDADAALRVELIGALKARRCGEAVRVLLAEARHESEAVRIAAFEALGVLGRASDGPALVELLCGAQPGAVVDAAVDATVAVCARVGDQEQRAASVLAAWGPASEAARVALVRVLGRVHGDAALARIRDARASDSPEVVDAAVRALADWPDATVLDDLHQVAEHSDSRTHHVLAVRGYVRLLGLPSEREPRETVELYETALSLAQRADEQKLALGGLAEVPHLDALRLAQRCLASEVLRAEAEAAVVAIARLIGLTHREEARQALDEALVETAIDATRTAAREALEYIRNAEGCLFDWMIAGPYSERGLDWRGVFAREFPPEDPQRLSIDWQPLEISNPGEPWVFDLAARDGCSDCCVYVRTRIWTEEARAVQLTVGSDDAVKVWLNDELVHEVERIRGHTPLEDRMLVNLEAGWNTLQVKVVQARGGWGFSCALRTLAGEPLEGLRCKAR